MFLARITHLLIVFLSTIVSIQAAKILAVFPHPGPSQYIAAVPYLKALAARGHELTVISQFPQKEKLTNYRDITVKYDRHEELVRATLSADHEKQWEFYKHFFLNVTLVVLENAEVQDLIFTKKENFDLVICEIQLTEALYAFATHLNAYLIGFSTYGTDTVIDQYTGNSSPTSYIPVGIKNYTNDMDFWQRLDNLYQISMFWSYINLRHLKGQNEIYKKYFPHLPYELDEICKNFSLVLLNQHFTVSYPRPYLTNLIEVGGLFIQPPKPLPLDIEEFIAGAEHGAIFFSLGSNIKSIYLDRERRETLMKVFGALKQRVLWKFEDAELPGKPSNVKISKWFPQSDILAHPNIKLFITHAGLLSTLESVYHAKPIVGIPVFFDQFYNAARAKNLGFGTVIDYWNLTVKDLGDAISEVLNNESYTKSAQLLSRRYHDRPIKPLDLAIYWTEYVLRHDGATHLQAAARNLSLWVYFSLDVISFILFVLFSPAIIIIIIWRVKKIREAFRCLLRWIWRKPEKKP